MLSAYYLDVGKRDYETNGRTGKPRGTHGFGYVSNVYARVWVLARQFAQSMWDAIMPM